MKLVKSLLLGSAAGLAAVAGARAADLPVQTPAPVEYVRVCTEYGAGFFYIPGTDTCLRVGGRVRAEYLYQETFNRRENAIGFLARGRLNVDARTATEYGTLRAFFRYEITRTTGAYRTGGGPIGADGDPSQETTSVTDTGTNLDRAFVQFGPLTAGRITSFYDFYANDLAFSAQLGSDRVTQTLAYTATLGNGFSATLAMEDPIERRTLGGAFQPNVFNATPAPSPFPIIPVPGTVGLQAAALTTGGVTVPDGVANIRYDNTAFGSAQLSAAVHQVRSANLTPNIRGAEVFRPDVVDTEYGFAVQGGVKINLPFLAAGDVLWLQAAYAQGAINYLGFGSATSLGTQSPLRLGQTDAFVNGRGELELTEGFAVVAALTHYWTPQLRSGLMGSYGELDYNQQGATFITANSAIGTAFPRLRGGRFGFVDTQEFRLEGNLIWSPVRDLDIGVDVLYQNINPQGRVVSVDRTVTGARAGTFRLVNDEDIVVGRFRVQRDF